MLKTELTPRQASILDVVKRLGSTNAAELADELKVSAQTIRREIAFLHEARFLARFHGGVSHIEQGVRTSFGHRQSENIELKRAMAAAALDYVPSGSTLFLGTGTTIGVLAEVLAARAPLRIFTTNVLTAAALIDRPGIDLYILGGQVIGSEGNVIGQDLLRQVDQLRFDIAFVGFSAFDDDGTPMDFDVDHYPVKRDIINNSRKVIALVDHSKFDRQATVRAASPSQLDVLITTAEPPDHVRRAMAMADVEVRIADARG